MPLFPISFPPRLLLPISEGDESTGGVRYIAEAQEPWSKEPLKHFVNSEFWSPRAKIHIFLLTLGFSGVPPVLSLSKEMGPISCMTAGAREVVKAVTKLLLALGFSACRREQMCFPFLTGGRCGVQPSATLFIFFFGCCHLSLGCENTSLARRSRTLLPALPARWVQRTKVSRPWRASPGMSHYSSDHGNKTLCPHLRFLFPKSLKGCFLQGDPLLGLLESGSSSAWAAFVSFSDVWRSSLLLQTLGLLHGPGYSCRKPMGLHLQISILKIIY